MKRTLTLLLCTMSISAFQYTNAQTITTVAGNNTQGSSGDGGAATIAELNTPFGVTVDGSGNIYIADTDNGLIRKVNTSGIITTIAGNGTTTYSGDGVAATATGLSQPSGIILDGNGNIYFADDYNYSIRKINPAGIISTVAGNGTQGYSGDGGAATAATFTQPSDIAFDHNGNLYIADYRANVIRMVNTSGIISTVAGNGTAGYTGDNGPATAAEFDFPYTIAIDGSNNMYVADQVNNVIRKINTSGVVTTIVGNGTGAYSGDGGAATAASLNNPTGVALDGSGNIYIADFFNNVIRKVNSSGIITTIAGDNTQGYSGDGGPATAAELNNPGEICVDGNGTVFIADTYNNVIRKLGNTTGVNNITNNDGFTATVAPNPATTNILVSYNGASKNVNIHLTDVTGKIVYSAKSQAGSGKVEISLATLPAGYYLLETESGNARTVNKVVKE